MSIAPEEQVPKSWVHETEHGSSASRIPAFFRAAELPGFIGGLALTYVGRRMRGATGSALSALGTTMALGAAGRFVYRVGPANIRGWIRQTLPPVTPAATPSYPG